VSRNKIKILNDYALIITQKGEEIIVDIEDIEKLSEYTWNVNVDHGYVNSRTKGKTVYIQRVILNTNSQAIDHINHNKLDNRKCNLRPCTDYQNSMNRTKSKNNTTGVNGVSYYKRYNKYIAHIRVEKKLKHLGYFDTIEQAKEARQEAEKKYYSWLFADDYSSTQQAL
jgi:hypothetical protein